MSYLMRKIKAVKKKRKRKRKKNIDRGGQSV